MKLTTISVLLILFLLIIQNTVYAQATFTPLYEGERAISVHAGYDVLLYELDFDDLFFDTQINQYATSFGFNYEEKAHSGFSHFRVGYMLLGKTKSKQNGQVETFTNWQNNQDFSIYMGGGYIHLYDIPLGSTSNEESEYILYAGGGFDLSALLFFENHTKTGTDYENLFYMTEFQIIAIVGMQIPDTGLTFSLSFSLHFPLLWESKQVVADSVTYGSDMSDLTLPPIGIETYLVHEFEDVPKLRFGITSKFINSLSVLCYAGYSF